MGFRRAKIGPVSVLIDLPEKYSKRLRAAKALWRRKSPTKAATLPVEVPSELPAEGQDLFRQVHADEWYHTIELPYGIVTPGCFDHRPHLDKYPLPTSLRGMRVLDLATFDGFWAFEMEKRGADEVVAVDVATYGELDLAPQIRDAATPEQLQKPTGARFVLCHTALRSKVHRETINLYQLSPELVGQFDLVFISDVLLHLQNPMKALANVRKVTRGQAIIVDSYHPMLLGNTAAYASGTVNCVWWYLSEGTLEQMIRDAGFREVRKTGVFSIPDMNDPSTNPCRAAFCALP